MLMMNWHSVGTKVIGITIAAVTIVGIGLVVLLAQTNKQNIIDSHLQTSKLILTISETIRQDTIEKWNKGIISTTHIKQLIENKSPSEVRSIVFDTIPIATAWRVIEEKAKQGHYRFKAPRLGARNKRNEADAFENKVLNYFQNNPGAKDYVYLDEQKEELRYLRPVRLDQQCEICHGDPATSMQLWDNNQGLDILGYPMENKRVGDLHGAFEIIMPLSQSFAELHKQTLFSIGFFFLLLLVIGITGYIAMSYIIVSPLTSIALKLQDIASGEGDLTARVKAKGKNEFSWVAYSFNTFVKKISKTVTDISATSDQLATASHQLARITQTTEDGVSRQLAETTQVATAMEEMTATVQEVARNAVNASETASTADNEASAGKSIVSQAVDEINRLASEVENAATVIHELENDSNSIGEVLSVIQGIAEQTNLLALNAAIEAARAGEQGRGFAVVADEVRTLASRTQNSTLEIQQTIERLQNRAKQAVGVMDNGKKQAAASVDQAASAGESITTISERIDTISDMNNQIANAAEEQTAVAEEINQNINNISAVSNETSVGARKTSAACQELSELADKLRQIVGQFKT